MSQATTDSDRALAPGARLGHYAVGRKLGEGGMGVVFVAQDTRLRRTVALKVLHADVSSDSDKRYRFLREGRLAAGLTHPCIATVYEVGEADGRVFIAMELVEGRSVGNLLEESAEHRLRPFVALRIAREVVRGLVKAHEAGIVHRDLKPDNVMYGEDQVVKILDFGIAKRTDDAQSDVVTAHATKQGSLIGTPAYMSPEQAAGRAVDARSDIFSLGVMLYEMLVGVRPFQGETWQEIIISVARDPLLPPSKHRPELGPTLDALLVRCLEKRPDDRFPSARALLEQLEVLLLDNAAGENLSDAVTAITITKDRLLEGEARATSAELTSGAKELSSGSDASSSGQRRAVPIALGIAAAFAVAGGVFWFTIRSGERGVAAGVADASSTTSAVVSLPAPSVAATTVVPSSARDEAAAPSPTTSATATAAPSSAPIAAPRTPAVTTSSASSAKPPTEPAKANKQNPILGF